MTPGMELKLADICKALSVETRLKIIKLLKTNGPLGAKTIALRLGVTPAAVSQHLKVLSQVGLVRSERKGFCIPYAIDEAVLDQCRRLLTETCLCGCHEARQVFSDRELQTASLERLRQFERDLQQQLDLVRKRIKTAISKPYIK
jgi:DNA-binding transcriptional ArsR family regulator